MRLETITSEDLPDEEDTSPEVPPPRPPPRYKRKVKLRGVENLNLDRIDITEDFDETHQNDILFKVSNSQHDVVEGEQELIPSIYFI